VKILKTKNYKKIEKEAYAPPMFSPGTLNRYYKKNPSMKGQFSTAIPIIEEGAISPSDVEVNISYWVNDANGEIEFLATDVVSKEDLTSFLSSPENKDLKNNVYSEIQEHYSNITQDLENNDKEW